MNNVNKCASKKKERRKKNEKVNYVHCKFFDE